jgi:hypothetical protein
MELHVEQHVATFDLVDPGEESNLSTPFHSAGCAPQYTHGLLIISWKAASSILHSKFRVFALWT